MTEISDHVALVDLDGTLANYDKAMTAAMTRIQAPGEEPYKARGLVELPYMETRRKMIQRQPGFWLNLEPIELGMEIINIVRTYFPLHVLTKGPMTTPSAWAEKVQWCDRHIPSVPVTIGSDKSLVYGRVLVDDWPSYFLPWLKVRPRGLVVCVAHPWNESFAPGGIDANPNIVRYDGSIEQRQLLLQKVIRAHDRKPGESL